MSENNARLALGTVAAWVETAPPLRNSATARGQDAIGCYGWSPGTASQPVPGLRSWLASGSSNHRPHESLTSIP